MWPFPSSCSADSGSGSCAAPSSTTFPPINFTTLSSFLPFLVIFVFVFLISHTRLFPLVSRTLAPSRRASTNPVSIAGSEDEYFLPSHAPAALHAAHAAHASRSSIPHSSILRRTIEEPERIVFAITVALGTLLGTVILADVGGWLDDAARICVLHGTVKALLTFLVVIIPAMELNWVLNVVFGWKRRQATAETEAIASATDKNDALVAGMSGRPVLPSRWWPRIVFTAFFGAWICVFWSVGHLLPASDSTTKETASPQNPWTSWTVDTIVQKAVARIAILGIASLATLSGVASVTTPWYTFGCSPAQRMKAPSEMDITRRQAGLDAATEMRVSKQHRLRSLQRKQIGSNGSANSSTLPRSNISTGLSSSVVVSDGAGHDVTSHSGAATTGAAPASATTVATSAAGKLWTTVRNAVAGDSDAKEMRVLQYEIQSLEDMEARLASGLAALKQRKLEAERRNTRLGRWLLRPFDIIFSAYCVYRVVMTVAMVLLRHVLPSSHPFISSSSATSTSAAGVADLSAGSDWMFSSDANQSTDPALASVDPVTRFLAVTTVKLGLVDRSHIDLSAWARMIAFLLSGVILLGSANGVVTTFRIAGRWVPRSWTSNVSAARRNLALFVGQVGGMYGIGAAVMLRGRVGTRLATRTLSTAATVAKTVTTKVGSMDNLRLAGTGGAGAAMMEDDVFSVFGDNTGLLVDRWFEGWFLCAALATMVGVWIVGWVATVDEDAMYDGVGDEAEWEEKGGVELGWKRS